MEPNPRDLSSFYFSSVAPSEILLPYINDAINVQSDDAIIHGRGLVSKSKFSYVFHVTYQVTPLNF